MAEFSAHSSFLGSKIVPPSRVDDVQVKRLDCIIDSLLKSVGNTPRVFLKMDTQGYDLEVMKGASGCINPIVLGLQSEIAVTEPVYENMPHYLECLAYYESLGFELMNLFTVTRTARYRSILEYDCLMARVENLDTASNDE